MLDLLMVNFSFLLTNLQAAIAVVSARERHLTMLLVAVWGRIGRMRTRLERLIALWRAGMLPNPRKSRAGEVRTGVRSESVIPTAPAWLLVVVREAAPIGAQLESMLSQEDCVRFLAAVPQAGRILRPLLRMLTPDAVPELIRFVRPAVIRVVAAGVMPAGVVGVPVSQISEG